jgi:hypothetical protein
MHSTILLDIGGPRGSSGTKGGYRCQVLFGGWDGLGSRLAFRSSGR